jgi:LacI family transcriptional regulator
LVTIKDVAKKAGVSISTVSHVVNDTRYVSEELIQRVQAAMQELQYQPNTLARGLRRGDTHTIGLIVPDNSNPFFAEIAHTIEDIGFQYGYNVILCNSHGDLAREATYLSLLISKQVDGVIFISAGSHPAHLGELINHNIPVVVADRDLEYESVDVVLVNNEVGGYLATKHLLDLGHTKIACVTGPTELTPSAARFNGYLNALNEAEIPVYDPYILTGDFQVEGGERAVTQLFTLDSPPSAVFLCNDLMAFGAFRALRKLERHIPEDVSIIGFDDIKLASLTTPALTTIAQPLFELSKTAVDLLIQRIQNGGNMGAQRVILEPVLVSRDSCTTYSGRE